MFWITALSLVFFIVLAGCESKSGSDKTSSGSVSQSDMSNRTDRDAAIRGDSSKTEDEIAAEIGSASVEQTTCPVMKGNPITKDLYTEYKGKKVYFCCSGCKPEFEKNPEKYLSDLPQFKK